MVVLIGGLSTPKERRLIGKLASKYRGLEQESTAEEREKFAGPIVKYRLYIFDLWPSIEKAGIQGLVALNLASLSPGPSLNPQLGPWFNETVVRRMQDYVLLDPFYYTDTDNLADSNFNSDLFGHPDSGPARYLDALMGQRDLRIKILEILEELDKTIKRRMKSRLETLRDLNRIFVLAGELYPPENDPQRKN